MVANPYVTINAIDCAAPLSLCVSLYISLLPQRRRRDFYDLDTSHWKLTGAARPAASLPGAGGKELVNERDPWEAGEDLFEKLAGGKGESAGSIAGFYEGPEACREYLGKNDG